MESELRNLELITQEEVVFPYPVGLNVGSFVSIKLNNNNYLLWETQITGLIESQGLWGFLDGSIRQPEKEKMCKNKEGQTRKEVNQEYISWRRTDRLIKAWIIGTLTEEVLGITVRLETAKDVWEAIKNEYAQCSVEHEFMLLNQLRSLKRENFESLQMYLRKFKTVCDELSSIGKGVEDQNRVFWLLSGLGKHYEAFVTSCFKPPMPTFNNLIPLLQGFEMRSRSHEIKEVREMAFFTNRGRGRTRGRFGTQWTHHQGRGEYRKNGQQMRGASVTSRGRGFQQANNRTPQPDRIKDTCQICEKPGHNAYECWHRFDHAFQRQEVPKALAATVNNKGEGEDWYMDSGASVHVTGNPRNLYNSSAYTGYDKIKIADGKALDIKQIGDKIVSIDKKNILLKNVCYVPQIKHNLLSIASLTNDMPYDVTFTNKNFRINDRKSGELICCGRKRRGTYVLKEDYKSCAFLVNQTNSASSRTWHERLGHTNYKNLEILCRSGAIDIQN